MSRRDVNNELSRAHRLIGKRLLAAEMQAHQMLRIFDNRQFAFEGRLIRLRIKGASTRRLATAIAHGRRQDLEEARVNVTSRVWSETKPVMHIAAALRLWLGRHKGETIEVGLVGKPGETRSTDLADLDIVQLVCCPDWLTDALLWAEAFRLPEIGNTVAPGMESVTVRLLPAI